MEAPESLGPDRRAFLGGVLPACAMTCMGSFALSLCFPTPANAAVQQDTHKFDRLVDPVPNWRQLEVVKIGRFLEFSEYLADQMGRERVIEILKDFQSQRNAAQAGRATQRLGSNDFDAFKRFYDPSIPALNRIVTMEIVENTDTVYEWKITECINAEPYLRANAADLGYAAACFGDYAFAESFNPAIKLTRNMTIMEGHPYCNHRYTWVGTGERRTGERGNGGTSNFERGELRTSNGGNFERRTGELRTSNGGTSNFKV